jgi:hypothetical protein
VNGCAVTDEIHILQRDFAVGRTRATEAIEGAFQVAEFVGGERPIVVLRGDPKSDMPRLDRRDHEIADARKVACVFRWGRPRGFFARSSSARPAPENRANADRRHEAPGLTRQQYWKASPDVIRLSEN